MFCLKLSDYCDRKAVIGRDVPAEVGQHCSEPTSFPTLRLMLKHPLYPYLTHFLKGSKGLAVHAWIKWFEKYTLPSSTIKGSEFVPSAHFFSSLFVSLPQLWSIHEEGLMQDVKTGKDLSCLSPFSTFIFLLPFFVWAKHSYNILLFTLYWGLLWGFGACWSLFW